MPERRDWFRVISTGAHFNSMLTHPNIYIYIHIHTHKHIYMYIYTQIQTLLYKFIYIAWNHIYRKNWMGEGCLQFSLLGKFRNSSSRLKISLSFLAVFFISPYHLICFIGGLPAQKNTTLKGEQQMSQWPVASQHSRWKSDLYSLVAVLRTSEI